MDRDGRKKVLGWVEVHFGVERVRRKQRVTEKRKKNLKASGLEKFQIWSIDSSGHFSFKDLFGWAKFI